MILENFLGESMPYCGIPDFLIQAHAEDVRKQQHLITKDIQTYMYGKVRHSKLSVFASCADTGPGQPY